MFTDPLDLTPVGSSATLSAVGTNVQLALLPSFDPGKSVRRGTIGSHDLIYTILHGNTKENKPYGTDRVSQRLDRQTVDVDGNLVTGFAQLIIGYPKSILSVAEVNALVLHLCSLSIFGPGATTSATHASQGAQFLARLKAGEG